MRANLEELVNNSIVNLLSPCLVVKHKLAHLLNQDVLNLASKKDTCRIVLADLRQLGIILQYELQVFVRHIHREVCTQASVLLNSLTTARERILPNLVLNLPRRVREEDSVAGVAGAHLARIRALEAREELGVDERRLVEAQARRHIARHAEVWVLVDGARDQAADVLFRHVRKQVGEAGRERGCGLDGGERVLADVVRFREPENPPDGRGCRHLLDPGDEGVHRPHVRVVVKDKGLARVEPQGDNVLGVFACKAHGVFLRKAFPQEFLVVRELDGELHVEGLLEPLGEDEGDEVPKVE